MSVYVDKANIPYRRMIMCHMLVDTINELHEMASKIGIQKRWFQHHGSTPHYDISLSKKKIALENGAIETDRRQLVKLIR